MFGRWQGGAKYSSAPTPPAGCSSVLRYPPRGRRRSPRLGLGRRQGDLHHRDRGEHDHVRGEDEPESPPPPGAALVSGGGDGRGDGGGGAGAGAGGDHGDLTRPPTGSTSGSERAPRRTRPACGTSSEYSSEALVVVGLVRSCAGDRLERVADVADRNAPTDGVGYCFGHVATHPRRGGEAARPPQRATGSHPCRRDLPCPAGNRRDQVRSRNPALARRGT